MSTKTLKEDKKSPSHSVSTVGCDRLELSSSSAASSFAVAKSSMISQKCLGIVLKRLEKDSPGKDVGKYVDSVDNIAQAAAAAEDWMYESGYLIFQDFQEANRQCFWNGQLIEAVNSVEYMGYVAPGTLLVAGNEYYLEALRTSWARRVLKSPANFIIARLGDVTGMEMQVISQTQFTPLPEALCLVISELNVLQETASLPIIYHRLQEKFNDMIVPNQEIVYVSLGKLIKDRKIYHTGDGYFIVTPETYRLTTMSPMPERPMLLTNEEAIQRLHGNDLLLSSRSGTMRSRSIQTDGDDLSTYGKSTEKLLSASLSPFKLERAGSLRLSRKDKHKAFQSCSTDDGFLRSESVRLSPEKSKSLIKDINLKSSPIHQDIDKGEKVSVFSKLFRRSSSKRRKRSKSPASASASSTLSSTGSSKPNHATFSAQFPPTEWEDPQLIHYHSRSTQTLDDSPSLVSSTAATLKSSSGGTLLSEPYLLPAATQTPHHNHHHHSLHHLSRDQQSPRHHQSNNLTANHVKPHAVHNHFTAALPNNVSPLKSKTDSMSRLRDQDKRHRSASSHLGDTADRSPKKIEEPDTTLGNTSPVKTISPNKNPTRSSSLPRRIVVPVQQQPVQNHAKDSATSALSPSKKPLAASTTFAPPSPALRKPPSGFGSSLPKTTSDSTPKAFRFSNNEQKAKFLSGKTKEEPKPTGNSPGRRFGGSPLRRTRTDEDNESNDVKISNRESHPEPLKNDEEYKPGSLCTSFCTDASLATITKPVYSSGRYTKRWSMHSAEGQETSTSNSRNGPVMNNSPSAPSFSKSYPNYSTKTSNITDPRTPTSQNNSEDHENSPNNRPCLSTYNSSGPLIPGGIPLHSSITSINNRDHFDSSTPERMNSQSPSPASSVTGSLDLEPSYQSITARKLLQGISVNSIDTLVEVNLHAEKDNTTKEQNNVQASKSSTISFISHNSSTSGFRNVAKVGPMSTCGLFKDTLTICADDAKKSIRYEYETDSDLFSPDSEKSFTEVSDLPDSMKSNLTVDATGPKTGDFLPDGTKILGVV